jgi:hypothetical protein
MVNRCLSFPAAKSQGAGGQMVEAEFTGIAPPQQH